MLRYIADFQGVTESALILNTCRAVDLVCVYKTQQFRIQVVQKETTCNFLLVGEIRWFECITRLQSQLLRNPQPQLDISWEFQNSSLDNCLRLLLCNYARKKYADLSTSPSIDFPFILLRYVPFQGTFFRKIFKTYLKRITFVFGIGLCRNDWEARYICCWIE